MRSERFIAHKTEDGREQTLLDHLAGTATLASEFASAFGEEALGELCGLTHDLGKYSAEFQARIRGANKQVDHATAGSKVLWQLLHVQAAFCVAGHHGGLPDGGNRHDNCDESTLFGRLKKCLPECGYWKQELALPVVEPPTESRNLNDAMLTRMLYSCLVDADYLDTERFMAGSMIERACDTPISRLLEMLDAHIEREGFLRPESDVNKLRAQVLGSCMNGGALPPGLFSLTVPTGGGKTIASMAFALRHAAAHGMRHVIYVIPYCSIIDQTAAKFRSIFGEENVLEHHSAAVFETGEDGVFGGRKGKMALAAENWDMPIIVTTSVQFFESMYANRSSRCRKLHNIANSVIVFDEAQMLPVPCLRPCVAAIGQLAARYRASAVLCTATQPALDELFDELAPGLTRHELCPDTVALYEALRRVTFRHAGMLDNSKLAHELQAYQQALCIVNSRAQAKEVFGLLEGGGNIHLSTLLTPERRTALIEEIRWRLSQGETCRVVSTSLIEAGVDVDFPAVFRAEAGLDSILQAAGRCNREGRREPEESVVTVFESETLPPIMLNTNIAAMKEATRAHPTLDSTEAIHAYFKSLLSLKGDALDQYGVLQAFERGLDGCVFPFRKIAERFRMIDNAAKTVYIPLGGGEELVRQLRAGHVSRALFRKLGRYGVTVYPQHFNELLEAGDIELMAEDAAVLTNTDLYDENTGLSLKAEWGKAYFG